MVDFLVLGAIVVIVFFCFWPSLFNGFASWDDNIYVVENESIRQLSWPAIKTIFTTDVSLNYTPLTILSFAAEYHFFGYNPFFYHLDNLLLHLGVVALIFVFAKQISSSLLVAAFASLFFGIHPMHVESVAWVTERKDVLYAVFYMLALIFYGRYLKSQRMNFYVVSLLCGFLSVLAKPMALSLPLMLLILDWFGGRKFEKKIIIEKIPFGLLIFSIAWLTYSLNSRVINLQFPDALLTWLWTFTFYIRKFFLPFNFLPLYELPQPVNLANLEFITSSVVALLIAFALIRWRQNRWFVFAFLFYFASIFFILRYDSAVDLCIVADRFMYLPSVGFCILLGVYFERLWKWAGRRDFSARVGVGVLLVSGLVYLGVMTYQQTKIWGDGVAFWNGVIKKYPSSAMAYNQRALAYKERGNLESALRDYSVAIALFPNYDFALTNRGIVYKELERYEESWADHSRAIVVNPGFSEAYLNRGNVAFSVGDFKRAIADYDQAIATVDGSARRKSTPYRAEAYSRRGSGYFFAKDYDAALKDFDSALKIDPDNIVALDNRAIIFSIRGENERALEDFSRSLALAPHNAASYVNRAQLYYQTGDRQAALRDIEAALKINSAHQRALSLKATIEQ
jgi:tetratricopeptide (TPR) repeat protein